MFLLKPTIQLVEYHYQIIKNLSFDSDMENEIFQNYLHLNNWSEDEYYDALIALEESNK